MIPYSAYGLESKYTLSIKFSMARKFTLQPLRIYDVNPPEKTEQT